MPRTAAVAVENNFRQGLITEASGLNFPENACTETYNCVFNRTGIVDRRLGINFETNYDTKTVDREDKAISTYLWKNVNGDGNTILFVMQIGDTLYFYDTRSSSNISLGILATTIDLTDNQASGSPDVDALECQFTNDGKYLIVTHPYCDPIYVSYDDTTSTATANTITIQIRDLAGDMDDPQGINERPTSTLAALNVHHHYNLLNQGWNTTNLTAWDTAQTTMPSNTDVMWNFVDSSDNFDASNATIARVDTRGGSTANSPAPKGHYIFNLSDQDRDDVSGLSGTTFSGTSYFRPTTASFFAGRIFYAGVGYAGYGSKIYFSQIIETDSQYGECYQKNDPTSGDLFDLNPDDGGVISIPESGTILKLFSISGALLVFSNNGVWSITGSTGLGFKANDYTVERLSSLHTLSPNSFVDVGGVPAWWDTECIYIIAQEGGAPTVKSLTLTTIQNFYDNIPATSKQYARGYFNQTNGIIQWIYKSTDAGTPTEVYTYDRILNFDTITGSFYPWSIDVTNVSINGIFVADATGTGVTETYTVIDDSSNTVVDDSGNTVITFSFVESLAASQSQDFKFLVSYVNGASYDFTIGLTNSEDYVDWLSYDDTGSSYSSYFITGYKIRGQGSMKFNPLWVNLYSNTGSTDKYYFRGIWDYSSTTNTNRWSSQQTITPTDTNYSVATNRLKVRGHGKALQFRVDSYEDKPFSIVGWSAFETINQLP